MSTGPESPSEAKPRLAMPNAIEIRIANVDFPTKVNAIAAALQAVRLAHQDEISPRSWALLNQVEQLLAEAILCRSDRRMVDATKPGAPFV